MTTTDASDELERQAEQLHEETTHAFRTSVSMSLDTRDTLGAIRDDLNDRIGRAVVDTDDVVRLALRGAARQHELADEEDPREIAELTAAIHDAVDVDHDEDRE
jgi:hypothetical protein